MKFIFGVFFVLLFLHGLDFDFEVDNIYHLNHNDFFVKDGTLYVKMVDDKSYKQLNKSIITKDSKIVVGENLNYYYHTNKFINFREDLIRLEIVNGFYSAYVGNRIFENCFIIKKYIEAKTMYTKSNSMVLDFSSLDSNVDSKVFFACLKKNNYIN